MIDLRHLETERVVSIAQYIRATLVVAYSLNNSHPTTSYYIPVSTYKLAKRNLESYSVRWH